MPDAPNTLLILSVVLVAGTSSGALAKRFHLPGVTGQILIGLLLGPVFGVFSLDDVHSLAPLIDFALGFMAVGVGSHLQLAKMKVARRRLILLLALEITLTPLMVGVATLLMPGTRWQMSLLLAAVAISTAPATILALVKETRSKGMFVKTLVMAVALNNLACISLFEMAHAAGRASLDPAVAGGAFEVAMAPLRQIALSALLGGGIGCALILVTRNVIRADRLTALSLIAILLTAGLGQQYGISVLLSCLFLGITLANLTPDKEEIGHELFDNLEYALFAVFFTLAGMELQFEYLVPGGSLALVTFLARGTGKLGAGYLAMKWAGATARVQQWLGFALVPQAGLAVGLMLIVSEDRAFPEEMRDLFLAVVLTVVLVNELVGPIMTRIALRHSGDFEKDRARVIDFLHEENITTDLRGPSKEAAIRQLVDLAIKSNRLAIDRDALYELVMEREKQDSTAIGEGLALPHARLPEGEGVVGAMGIAHKGLDIGSLDGQPTHCMVLILTPISMPERHLEVLGALARAMSHDRTFRQQLFHVDTPAHAYELLHVEEESEDFNRFIEDA